MKVLLPKLEKPFAVAVSGGVDSMALMNFCYEGRKKFHVVHFNHGTEKADKYEEFVVDWCRHLKIDVCIRYYCGEPKELYWANWRNEIMQKWRDPVFTAHHANDSLESYLMRGKKISYQNGNIYRPLIEAKKQDILDYAKRKDLEWIEDPTNKDNSIRRNKIRNVLIPQMVECGIDPFNLM